MSSIFSAESAVSHSVSKEPACELAPSVRSILTAAKSSGDTGLRSPATTTCELSLPIAFDQMALPLTQSAGGFPCQDISYAGFGAGLAGERSGLFYEYARLISELEPDIAIVENVSALLDRGMADVLGTLSDLRYHAIWDTVSACAVGHTHMRRRVFIVAYADRLNGWEEFRDSFARSYRTLQTRDRFESARAGQRTRLADPSRLYGGADGLPYGMERNHAIGNAVAPAVAQTIGEAIMSTLSRQGGSNVP